MKSMKTTDHIPGVKKKPFEKVLIKEEAWHDKKRGSSGKGADWEQGFIEGIQHSRLLYDIAHATGHYPAQNQTGK